MHVVRGGVDIARFAPVNPSEKEELRTCLNLPLNTFVALAVCRLESFKGLMFALEVIVTARPKNFLYLIAGDGPLAHELQQHAKRLGISALVRFDRTVPHSVVHEYYKAADLYCHFPEESVREVAGGSYVHTETMGRSFCEAMASGLPVLATMVGGVPEIVNDDVEGILIPSHDLAAAVAGLIRLIEDTVLYKSMADAGRDKAVALYSWDKVRARYEDIFSL